MVGSCTFSHGLARNRWKTRYIGRRAVFWRHRGRVPTDRLGLERGDQVLIAAISGPAPNMLIIRFRLQARTWRLISVRTLSSYGVGSHTYLIPHNTSIGRVGWASWRLAPPLADPPPGGPARQLLNWRTGMSDHETVAEVERHNVKVARMVAEYWRRKASRLGRMATQQRRSRETWAERVAAWIPWRRRDPGYRSSVITVVTAGADVK